MSRKIMFLGFSFLVAIGLQASEITKTFTFEEENLSFAKYKNYVVPHLGGVSSLSKVGKPTLHGKVSSLSKVGKPALLSYSSYILLPPGATAEEVEVVSSTKEKVAGKYFVCPAQPPRPLSLREEIEFIPPDPLVYESSLPYPGKLVELVSTGSKAGYRIAGIFVYPLQYNPVLKELEFYSSITVRIRYKEDKEKASLTPRQREVIESEVESLVDNPEDISRFHPPIKFAGGNLEYAIITPSTYKDKFTPLVEWKNKRGIRTRVITTNHIYGNYAGDDNQEKIRNFIKEAFSDSGLIWVLIGGDDDVVPARKSEPGWDYSGEKPYADLYYSDLNGTWDGNNNRYYGEPSDNIDMYADVFVGRAPASSSSEFTSFVNKILTYEKNPPPNYLTKALLVGGLLFAEEDYWGEKIGSEIAFVTPANFTDIEIYQKDGNLSRDAVTSNNNAGVGLGEYALHGNPLEIGTEDGILIMDKSDASSYSNTNKYGIHNTIACHAGQFDDTDCLLEALVTNPNGGALASMGNSRYGIGIPPSLGPTEKMILEFYERLFYGGIYHLAETFGASKDVYVNDAKSETYIRYCLYELNLFGPSSVPIWTAEPGTLSVAYNLTVPCFQSNFTVTVTKASTGTPINNAYVCCMMDSTVYARGYTNSSGEVTLSISPIHIDDTMWVTTTVHNYLPDEGYAIVISGGPRVIYLKHSIDDDNFGASSGNDDNNVNPGETIELPLWVRNIASDTAFSVSGDITTSDAYITITPASKDYGTIVPDDSTMSPTPYVFNVGATTPDSHTVTFDLTCKDSFDSTWVSSFEIMVIRAPDIEVNPDSLGAILVINDSTLQAMIISNVGTDTLTFEIRETVASPGKGQGGPDAGGYAWIDSDEPEGPTYNWIDITTIGTEITGIGDDDNVGPFDIGFSFPFYHETFTTFRFCANGFISFTSTSQSSSNRSLPHTLAPFNLIAPFWKDLDFRDQGNAYYWSDGQKLVIEYYNVTGWNGNGGPYTFEIILKSDGTITYQYQTMGEPTNSATVGIQNNDGTIGLEVVHNAGYIKNNLAVEISKIADVPWFSETPISGSIPPGDAETITVKFNSTGLVSDTTYKAWLKISSNDPDESVVYVPITLTTVDILNKGDVGPIAIIGLPDTVFLDSTYSPQADIANFGANPAEDFNVICNIDTSGYNVYTDTKFVSSIEGGGTTDITFADWMVPEPRVNYTVTVFTMFSGDTVSGNDTMTVMVHEYNDAPMISGLPDTSFPENGSIQIGLDNYVFDSDDPASVLNWSYFIAVKSEKPAPSEAEGLKVKSLETRDEKLEVRNQNRVPRTEYRELLIDGPIYVDIDFVTHIATITADPDWSGERNIIFIAEDPWGVSGRDTMLVTVTPVISDTAIVSIPDDTVAAGSDTNMVYINLENPLLVAGVQIVITYDTLLTAHEARTTSRSSMMSVSSSIGKDSIQVLLSPDIPSDTITSGTGYIIEIPFDISSNAVPGDSTLLHIKKVVLSDTGAEEMPSYSVDGWLYFTPEDTTLPQVTVISPDSGETCVAGATDTIKWTATDVNGIDSVSIYLSLDGGGSYPYTIAQGIPNASPYLYTVMDTFSTECKVKVIAWDPSGNSAEDESNYDFVIAYGERGNVNGDGEINILDVTRTINIIQGYGDLPTSYELWAADVKEDGEINILDIVAIVHCIQGKDIGQIANVGNSAIVSISRAGGIIGTDDNIVYVNLKNQIGVTGIQIRIGYDQLLLTPREARTTSSSDILNISSMIDTNYIQMLLYSTSLDTIASDNRTIIEIPFYISPSAGVSDSTLLHIEYLLLSDVSAYLIPSRGVDGWLHFGTQDDTDGKVPLPKVYGLSQASPNPCVQRTVIRYQLPVKNKVSLKIYDMGGRLVKTLYEGERNPGYHQVEWDMRDNANKPLHSGIYFYRMETGEFKATKKLIIVQ